MTLNAALEAPEIPLALAGRRALLRALYGSSPDDLFFELRCIHPVTGEARALWSPVGDRARLAEKLRQAEALNAEGFGIFFAPCLRRTMKGSADAAVYVPALWIDIDCGGDEREGAFDRLTAFDPPPSFVVDSGGGLHGYWVLDEPVTLKTTSDRARMARYLHGLFAVLGGDPAYSKSVASVMRLPDTVNTKPERGGAVAQVIAAFPDRRYPLSVFDWLKMSQESAPTPVGQGADRDSTNGQHPLPPRTEQYLATGAADGQRNAELFAAACQMRDAGRSQSEAERDLIARYVADGAGENPVGREREARATITSAYKRPAREPIQSPRERISTLIDTLPAARDDRPDADMIAEAVQACAEMNAVEWADARQRLKAVCGDGVRLNDLDLMYREARRDVLSQRLPDEDRYVIVDGCIVYERITEKGVSRQRVADWTAQVVERMSRIDDDGQVEHFVKLELNGQGSAAEMLTVPSELFGDPNALQRFIARSAGERFTTRTNMSKHLPTALLSLSGEYPLRTAYRFMGWTQIDGRWAYVAPGLTVGADGVFPQTPEVELEQRLRDYGLRATDWTHSAAAFAALVAALPEDIAPALIAYAFLPLVQRFYPAAAPKPALHLQGTTGTGKSEIASLLASLYGVFTRDMPPAQWGDTVNAVESLGYALADSLYWVDDYKSAYADERSFTRFLQSYSRGMGRGRLARDSKIKAERACRGHVLSTGETTLEGEASVLARMLVLKVAPWGERDPGGQTFARADKQRERLSGFTVAFARWIAGEADSRALMPKLAQAFTEGARGMRETLEAGGEAPAGVGRLVQNWAVLLGVYRLLREFLSAQGITDLLPEWRDVIHEGAQAMREERAGMLFIDALRQLLASGDLLLATNLRNPEEARPGAKIVGYDDGEHVLILPDVAYRAASRIRALHFNTGAIGAQLQEDGWLIPGGSGLTVQRRVRGVVTRFWQVRKAVFER